MNPTPSKKAYRCVFFGIVLPVLLLSGLINGVFWSNTFGLDHPFRKFLARHPLPYFLEKPIFWFSHLGDPVTVVGLTIILGIIALRLKRYRLAWNVLLAEAMAIGLIELVLKDHLKRYNALPWEQINTFPSGHAMVAVCYYGFLFYLWRPQRIMAYSALRIPVWLGFVFVIGLSRLLLEVHQLSDVLGGYLLAIPLLTLGISAYEHYRGNKTHPSPVSQENTESIHIQKIEAIQPDK